MVSMRVVGVVDAVERGRRARPHAKLEGEDRLHLVSDQTKKLKPSFH